MYICLVPMKQLIIITIIALLSGLFGASEMLARKVAQTFWDVQQTHAYATAIQYLKDQGIISGYADGTFGMRKAINRAELLGVAMKAVGLKGNGGNCFKDVKTEWFAPYVCEAKIKGFVKGYGDGFFRPANNITFTEAAAVITNVFDIGKTDLKDTVWYKPYVVALEKRKAIPISILQFDKEVNRGQIAETVWRLLTNTTTKESMTYRLIDKRKAVLNNKMKTFFYPFGDDYMINKLSKGDRDLLREMEAKAFIEMENIEMDESVLPQGFDKQIAREINALATMVNENYSQDISLPLFTTSGGAYLLDHKNYAYLALPPSQYVTFYSLDADTATLVGETCMGKICSTEERLYIRDKNYVYELSDDYSPRIVEGIDGGTFGPLDIKNERGDDTSSIGLFKDKNHVYSLRDGKFLTVPNADPVSLELVTPIGDTGASSFLRDKNAVFILNAKTGLEIIDGVDAQSFKVRTVLCGGTPILETDRYCTFAMDSKNVWIVGEGGMKKIEGLERATFEIIPFGETGNFFSDENAIYSMNGQTGAYKKLVDVSDQQKVYGAIYKDEDHVYYFDPVALKMKRINDLDIETFQLFLKRGLQDDKEIEVYLKDKNNAWAVHSESPFEAKLVVAKFADSGILKYYGDFIIHYIPADSAESVVFQDDENQSADTDPSWIPNKNPEIWRDNSSVFLKQNGHLVKQNVDPKTFEYMWLTGSNWENGDQVRFFKDFYGVYYLTGEELTLIENSDPETFSSVFESRQFYKDKKNVYYFSWRDNKINIVNGADPNSFAVVYRSGTVFASDKSSLYYFDASTDSYRRNEQLDLTKFKRIINYFYADDKNIVYYHDPQENKLIGIKGGDAKTFWPIMSGRDDFAFYKDKENVFYVKPNGYKILKLQDADSSTFERLDHSYSHLPTFKDKYRVYYTKFDDKKNGKVVVLAHADAATLEPLLDANILKDRHNVYVRSRPSSDFEILENADPATFEKITVTGIAFYRSYFKDKKNVWLQKSDDALLEKIPGVDPATFDVESDAKKRSEKYTEGVLRKIQDQ